MPRQLRKRIMKVVVSTQPGGHLCYSGPLSVSVVIVIDIDVAKWVVVASLPFEELHIGRFEYGNAPQPPSIRSDPLNEFALKVCLRLEISLEIRAQPG